MNDNLSNLFYQAQKKTTQADIVFCIDVTGSMKPCIDAVKANLMNFVTSLQSAANVDARFRLIAYRDIHDTNVKEGQRVCEEPWFMTEFTHDIKEFESWLDHRDVQAFGGGDDPESTLDALYLAITKSDWREHKAHRTIILFTDDDSHPELHSKTCAYPHRGVGVVFQAFQTLKHAMLFMVVPRLRIYEQLEKAVTDAKRKIIAHYVPYHNGDDKHPFYGLKAVNWTNLMQMLGTTVSITSLEVQ